MVARVCVTLGAVKGLHALCCQQLTTLPTPDNCLDLLHLTYLPHLRAHPDAARVRYEAVLVFAENFAHVDLVPLRRMRNLEEDVFYDVTKALQVYSPRPPSLLRG